MFIEAITALSDVAQTANISIETVAHAANISIETIARAANISIETSNISIEVEDALRKFSA